MSKLPPGRPIQNNAPRTLERFHIYLLLVLGIALVGAGITVLGFLGQSPAAVGMGAGAVVAAGLIAGFFALTGHRPTIETKNIHTDAVSAALARNPYPEHPRTAHDDNATPQ
jgi:hypothetical protein